MSIDVLKLMGLAKKKYKMGIRGHSNINLMVSHGDRMVNSLFDGQISMVLPPNSQPILKVGTARMESQWGDNDIGTSAEYHA